MATILHLANLVGLRCGRHKEVPTFVLRAREADILPDSGRGGRGSVGAPAATAEHAVALLLAMLMGDRAPKEATREVASALRTPLTDIAIASYDGQRHQAAKLNVDIAALPSVYDPTRALGLFLRTVIDDKRQRAGADIRCVRLERNGSVLTAIVTCDAPDGTCWHFAYGFPRVGSTGPEAVRERVHAMPMGASFTVGGQLLDDIATLLGPISVTGGGGPAAGTIADKEDALAALLDRVPIAAMTTPSDLRVN